MTTISFMNNGEIIGLAIFIISSIILVILIGRELFCWYWKVNARISIQHETLKILKEILYEIKRTKTDTHVSAPEIPSIHEYTTIKDLCIDAIEQERTKQTK